MVLRQSWSKTSSALLCWKLPQTKAALQQLCSFMEKGYKDAACAGSLMLQAPRAAQRREPAQISRKWGCTLAIKWSGGRTQLHRMLPGECPEFLLALAGTLWESARTQERVSKDQKLFTIMGHHYGSGHTAFWRRGSTVCVPVLPWYLLPGTEQRGFRQWG